MVTALTVYSTNTDASTISTARKLVTVSGAGSTNTFSSKCGTSTGFSELYSQGTTNNWQALGSIGTPSGNGFFLEPSTLDLTGQRFIAGNWTVRVRARVSVGSVVADFHVRAYITNGSTYTQIGTTMTMTGQNVNTTSTNFDFAPASLAAGVTIPSGYGLYLDCWPRITSNSTGSASATFSIVEAVSSTQGNSQSFRVETSGYDVGVTTVTKTLVSRFRLRVQNTRTLGFRFRERVQATKTFAFRFLERTQLTRLVPVRFVERTQLTKSLPVRTRLQVLRTVITPIRLVLQQISTTLTFPIRLILRSRITKSVPVRFRIRTQQTLTLPVRLVMIKAVKALGVRAVLRVLAAKTLPLRTILSTQITKTIPFRLVERVTSSAIVTIRARITLPSVTKTLVFRTRLRNRQTMTLPFRFRLNAARILSGGFTLFASGTGTASFDQFRVTAYPDLALDLSKVGDRVGSTLVSWNELKPSNTTLGIDISRDGVNWTDVSGNNGGSIPGIVSQPDPVIDGFDTNSSASYTSGNLGGSNGSWVWDTSNSRITGTGGSNATLIYNPEAVVNDGFIEIDIDQADDAGCIGRYVDSNNCYFLRIWDSSGSTQQNKLQIFKRAGGVNTQIGSTATIDFERDIPHKVRLDIQAGQLTATFDGEVKITHTDGSPLASGKFGLFENSAIGGRFYQVRMQPYGEIASGYVYTQARLTTSDPAAMPQLLDLTTSVRGPRIANGALIPQLHDVGKPFAVFFNEELKSLASASGDYFWDIDDAGEVTFQKRRAIPAPWILHSSDLLNEPTVTPLSSAELYRNRMTITNCLGITTTQVEQKIADGSASSWNMAYPLHSAPLITVEGISKTVGVQGVDAGKDFYWQKGSVAIGQDNQAEKFTEGYLIEFSYIGQFETSITRDNLAEQAARAAVEIGTSGIVEAVEDGKGMLESAAIIYADGLLEKYNRNDAVELTCSTERKGLRPGMLLSVFLPEHKLHDRQLLITKMLVEAEQKEDGEVLYTYTITATDGANLTDWAAVFF